jgi:hypothetical protein
MEQSTKGMLQTAMQYGTNLGIFWIVAFAVYVISITTKELSLLFLMLLAAAPVYAGYLGMKYRKKECENKLTFLNAWSFMIIIYTCASVLSAIACYIYFYFIDGGTMLAAFKEQIDIYTSMEIGEEMKKAFNETYDILSKLNASGICIQYFTSNLFISSILAPLTSIFVYKK